MTAGIVWWQEDVLDTEQLPVGWQGDGIFVLHYVSKKGKSHSNYLLKIIPIDSSLLLHLKVLIKNHAYELHTIFSYSVIIYCIALFYIFPVILF